MTLTCEGCYISDRVEEHIAKRGVIPEEVYEVLENGENRPVWKRIKSTGGASPVYEVYGVTEEGRYLFIVGILFADPPLKNCLQPATARIMKPTERAYYQRNRR